ncbi:SCO2524 family protein [Streptomyces albus]|uniref:SCO2524 family protein n=1 Tax=Streptomyces albus TaxID=1888 RepID=UPI0004C9C78D|nr:SCO2524 family protein [Streptomyces albus]
MQIKPRQQLLDIWRAIARYSFVDGEWDWGKSGGRSTVADAERLLCILYPATEFPAFRLDDPDTTDRDVRDALQAAGSRLEIPAKILSAVAEFMRTHTTDDKRPSFAGGHYFNARDSADELTPEQRELGVVDSFSLSITLSLATLGFLKVYLSKPRRAEVQALAEELRTATEARLTAAMVSLLRSFTVNVFDAEAPQGRTLCKLLGQGQVSERIAAQQFQRRFKALRATIRDSISLGVEVADGLDDDNQLFECGWAWSLVKDAPPVEIESEIGPQPDGIARPTPYLYFTVVALDGIQDLFSDRTLTLGLLNTEQQRLADALRLRWEITQQYWSGIARFGDGSWPLEDIPWRTTGQRQESEYFSLSVAAILVHDLVRRRATDDDLTRTVDVMQRLAERGRITSRMKVGDAAVELHNPGVAMPLQGSEALGPPMQWSMPDFSAQLLKRTIQLCSLSRSISSHDRLLRLAERIFDHLWQRRIRGGETAGLWDNIHAVYPDSPDRNWAMSWSITERVTECMVAARQLYTQPPIRSGTLTTLARDLLSEATHLLGNEQLEPTSTADGSRGMALKGIEVKLARARRILEEQPGTSCALSTEVLGELDTLALARQTASRGV